MRNTPYKDTLPNFYFKGLYNKGEIPNGFEYLYSMLGNASDNEYDSFSRFSSVYSTEWK